MYKKLILAAVAVASMGSAGAVVVVNGVPGEDLDNASPFETLQVALDFANSGSETDIEIQTAGPLVGATLNGRAMTHPITIQGGTGFFPRISSVLEMLPTTGTELVTLKNLNVLTTGNGTALIVGTNLTADNCIFKTEPGGANGYFAGVTAAVTSSFTTSTVNMTSCTLFGHNGLQAGRAAKNYNLTRCEIVGQPVDLSPGFSVGIANNMNWFSDYSFRMGAAQGFVEITEPRTVSLDQCIVRGGVALGWPNLTLDNTYYANENFTMGPITAKNTVFDTLNLGAVGTNPGQASKINTPALPPTQNTSSTFTHCTFRSLNSFGLIYFFGGQPSTYTWNNCLFDMMNGNYGIGVDPGAAPGSVILAGDANTYHVPAGNEVYPYGNPAFEATKHFYIGNDAEAANITNANGGLLRAHNSIVAQAISTIPATAVDKDSNPRPMPAVAAANDIGADEINESAAATVNDWAVY